MNFPFYVFFFSIVLLLIATYTDLKSRLVPNKLTYPFIALGLLLHGFQSFSLQSINPLIFSVIGAALAFGFALLLRQAGVWAGGDVKLFAALGALNPINYFFLGGFFGLQSALLTPIQLPFYPITLFIFSLLAMLPYAILISLAGMLKSRQLTQEFLGKLFAGTKKSLVRVVQFAVLAVGVKFAFQAMALPLSFQLSLAGFRFALPLEWLAGFAVLMVIMFAPLLFQAAVSMAALAVSLFFGQVPALLELAAGVIVIFVLLFAVRFLFGLMAVNKKVLRKTVPIASLEDGDIVAETIVEENGKIKVLKGTGLKGLILLLKENNLKGLSALLNPKGRVITSGRRAAGVSPAEIAELNKLVKEKKLKKEVEVKLSAPYAPALLIAFVILSLVGDVLWHVFF